EYHPVRASSAGSPWARRRESGAPTSGSGPAQRGLDPGVGGIGHRGSGPGRAGANGPGPRTVRARAEAVARLSPPQGATRMDRNELVCIGPAECVRETEKAWLV